MKISGYSQIVKAIPKLNKDKKSKENFQLTLMKYQKGKKK